MAVVNPFCGLMPCPAHAAHVASVPYDVVNREEAAGLAAGNPLSFLRVSRPEIEMEPGIDLYSEAVYARAKANFERLIAQAPLSFDKEPALYIYALTMGTHRQIGIVGATSTEEYEAGLIKKHEKTRTDKEDDRTRHVMTLRSQTGPVFLTYRDQPEINQIVETLIQNEPLFDFVAPDHVRHQLWRVASRESIALQQLFRQQVPVLYIADGHHRAAAAVRSAQLCKKENRAHTGQESYNFFLSVTFPASQLRILPYNRVIKAWNGLNPEAFLAQLRNSFEVWPSSLQAPEKSGEFCFYMAAQWYGMRPKFDITTLGTIERLDVSILQDYVLAPLLGIADPRTSKQIDFIGGIRGTQELVQWVDSQQAVLAFSMFPTTLDQLMAIADAGAIMPPKSTWFEPKLRDGLLCHCF